MPPLRRRDELIVRQVADETLVYDERNDRAHCLNRAAAMVWAQCNGRTSPEEIAAALGSDIDVVRLAIQTLDRAQLLEPRADGQETRGMSRREVTRRLGLAAGVAAALPLVISIIAPTPLMAASCVPKGGACDSGNGPNHCCPGHICMGNGTCS
jgi:hypothetical protein